MRDTLAATPVPVALVEDTTVTSGIISRAMPAVSCRAVAASDRAPYATMARTAAEESTRTAAWPNSMRGKKRTKPPAATHGARRRRNAVMIDSMVRAVWWTPMRSGLG